MSDSVFLTVTLTLLTLLLFKNHTPFFSCVPSRDLSRLLFNPDLLLGLFLQPVGELGRVFTGIRAFLQPLYGAGNLMSLLGERF